MSEIEMTVEAVREIANRTMGALQQQAQSSTRRFGDVDLPVSAFGGWHQAQALGKHHRAAHEVFTRTLEGVLTDLEEFAQNLRDTADSSERRDEEVQASLVALGKGYRDRVFRSQRNYTETVHELSGLAGVDAADLAGAAGRKPDTVTQGQVPAVDGPEVVAGRPGDLDAPAPSSDGHEF